MVCLMISRKKEPVVGVAWKRSDNVYKPLFKIPIEKVTDNNLLKKRYPFERIKNLLIRELVKIDDCREGTYSFFFTGIRNNKKKGKKNGGTTDITFSDFEKYIVERNLLVPPSIRENQIKKVKANRLSRAT